MVVLVLSRGPQRWAWVGFGASTIALGATLYALALPGPDPFTIGPFSFGTEGMRVGALEMLRALGLFSVGVLVARLIRIDDLWPLASRRPMLLYVLASSSRLLPSLREDSERVRRSQLARGHLVRNAWRHPGDLVPLLVPLIVSALRRAREQAWSLELAGLGRRPPP